MKLRHAAVLVSAFCLLISCGGDGGGGGKGGSGGSGGAAGASAGGGVSGTAGNTGSGTAGASGTAGSGGGMGSCQACNTCVTASCASQVAACMGNSDCNKIYQCAKACTTTIQTCILNNVTAAQMFASSVVPCINSNCSAQCTY